MELGVRTARRAAWMLAAGALLAAGACREGSSASSGEPGGAEAGSSSGAARPAGQGGGEGEDEPRDGGGSAGAEPSREGNGALAAVPELDRLLEEAAGEHWYGVYVKGRKAGHARGWLRRSREDEPGAVAVGLDLEMSIAAGGRDGDVTMATRRYYATDPPHELVETRFRQDTPRESIRRRAVSRSDALVVEVASGEGSEGEDSERRRLPPTEETLASSLATAPSRPSELRVGAETSVPLFNWQLKRDERVHVRVEAVETLQRSGVATPVATLAVRYEGTGLESTMRVARGGKLLDATVGPGLTLRLEEREVATSGVEGLDVLSAGVPVDEELGEPGEVARLVLELSGADADAVPEGPGQRVEPEGGALRIELRSGSGGRVGSAEREEALRTTGAVDAEADAVERRARELVEGVEGRRDRVERLVAAVDEHVTDRLATHVPRASAVLAEGVGDCTEHALLLVALARALDIPARRVSGLAYPGDASGRFGYHAWVEVVVDGRWLPVDPAWGQVPVDATHLALERGAPGAAVARTLGELDVEVVEVERAP